MKTTGAKKEAEARAFGNGKKKAKLAEKEGRLEKIAWRPPPLDLDSMYI